MMEVKVVQVGEGLHPSEIVVGIQTIEGQQNLVIDKRSLINNDFIRVGYPIRQDSNKYLIELPRETMNGSWRVWVNRDQTQIVDERAYA